MQIIKLTCEQVFNSDTTAAAPSQPQNQVKFAFFLNIIMLKSISILQLLTSEDKSLLIRRNPLFVLYFIFKFSYRVARFNF